MTRAFLTLLLLTSYGSSCTTAPSYVAADRLTFRAIAQSHRKYVMADKTLTAAQKRRRLATLASWEARIRAASPAR